MSTPPRARTCFRTRSATTATLVYVPNSQSDNVSVIDPATFQVIDTFPGGPEPQHVVPSYDLQTLYVGSSRVPSGGLVPIDPRTGRSSPLIEVQDVYNMYFTPDGAQAIVVAEAFRRLDFYDPKTWQRVDSLSFPECAGINHMDYSADGRTMLFSCEFANRVIVVDAQTRTKVRDFDLDVAPHGMPQDTRLTPDGKTLPGGRHACARRLRLQRRRERSGKASFRPGGVRTASISVATPSTPTCRTVTRAA